LSNKSRDLVSLFSFCSLFLLSACASLTGVTTDRTELKINPDKNAGKAMILDKGEKVSLSNSTVFGFYRAITTSGRKGWVKASRVQVDGMPSRAVASTDESGDANEVQEESKAGGSCSN
jgi:hypothetical protein